MSRFNRLWQQFIQLSPVQTPVWCLDLGSVSTRLLVNEGQSIHQPTCVAVHVPTQTAVEVGEKAYSLLGKTPENVEVVFPVQRGVISHPQYARLFLQAFLVQKSGQLPTLPQSLRDLKKTALITRPHVLCSVPNSASPLDKNIYSTVLLEAGAGSVALVNKADALAARLYKAKQQTAAVCGIDIGGDTTEVMFLVGRQPMFSRTLLSGGRMFTTRIREIVREELHCQVGWQTAEKLKSSIGVVPPAPSHTGSSFVEKKMVVRGKDIVKSIPSSVQVSNHLFKSVFGDLAQEIVDEVKAVFTQVPEEILAPALENGMFITGGGSLVSGLTEYLAAELRVPPLKSSHPFDDVLQGLSALKK